MFWEKLKKYIETKNPSVTVDLMKNGSGINLVFAGEVIITFTKYGISPELLDLVSDDHLEEIYEIIQQRAEVANALDAATRRNDYADKLYVSCKSNDELIPDGVYVHVLGKLYLEALIGEITDRAFIFCKNLKCYPQIKDTIPEEILDVAIENTISKVVVQVCCSTEEYTELKVAATCMLSQFRLTTAVKEKLREEGAVLLDFSIAGSAALILVPKVAELFADCWNDEFVFFFVTSEKICIAQIVNKKLMIETKSYINEHMEEHYGIPQEVYHFSKVLGKYDVIWEGLL